MKKTLLTIDVEEFDLPREYGVDITDEQMYNVSKEGLFNIVNLLKRYSIKATFFVTANFAMKYPRLLINLDKDGHEIASHGYSHSSMDQSFNQIKNSKSELERIIKRKIMGYRAPRFNMSDFKELSDMGFNYDSSIHPTFIPGRYNNLSKPRNPYKIGDILEIPPSVLPFIRLPIFWLAFKNFPRFYQNIFTEANFLSSEYLMLVFHSWEFADLKDIKIPGFIKKKHGSEMTKLLEEYIAGYKEKYPFDTIFNWINGEKLLD
ncbi:polysaccharide deacetylase family protein [Candidatus Pacearchaeota archaeon]|nr:polysaccharide deacetylase family protein [Candidatus Pacearchaeota archaeon]